MNEDQTEIIYSTITDAEFCSNGFTSDSWRDNAGVLLRGEPYDKIREMLDAGMAVLIRKKGNPPSRLQQVLAQRDELLAVLKSFVGMDWIDSSGCCTACGEGWKACGENCAVERAKAAITKVEWDL